MSMKSGCCGRGNLSTSPTRPGADAGECIVDELSLAEMVPASFRWCSMPPEPLLQNNQPEARAEMIRTPVPVHGRLLLLQVRLLPT